MTLIGKPDLDGHLCRVVSLREQRTRGTQPQPDEIGVWRQPKGLAELSCQAKTINARISSQLVETDIVFHVRVQIFPSSIHHVGRIARNRGRPDAQVSRQKADHLIEVLVASQSAFGSVYRLERALNGGRQQRVFWQGSVEGVLKQRNVTQTASLQRAVDPRLGQVQHRVGETASFRGVPVVDRARLDEDGATGRAGVNRAMAIESLDALLGDAYQHFVVIVRVVGMTAKVRMHALDPRFRITAKVEPVVTG